MYPVLFLFWATIVQRKLWGLVVRKGHTSVKCTNFVRKTLIYQRSSLCYAQIFNPFKSTIQGTIERLIVVPVSSSGKPRNTVAPHTKVYLRTVIITINSVRVLIKKLITYGFVAYGYMS